jgi:Ala-tRNA(Pro) deacylase
MPADQTTLFARLDALGIAHVTVEHAPMFTVEQSQALRENLPGAHTKNLFLKDKAGRLALVVAKEDTRIDLKALAPLIGMGRLSFGSADQLMAVVGVTSGSVTPFALINDPDGRILVVVDAALTAFAEVNCHPLRNDATTRLATADLLRFIEACGHKPLIVALA